MSSFIKATAVTAILSAAVLLCSCSDKLIEKREESEHKANTSITDTISESGESPADTEVILPIVEPDFINPQTGLEVSEELSTVRPVAVMINNIKAAMPQHGTSGADVIYECIVEGAQTRLLAVYTDYEDIELIGSVRSAREYYLDFAANHDAVFVHAGGSEEAYRQIKNSKVQNLDGVNMYVPGMFFRDQNRIKTHAYEHTLMTDGEKIKDGIDFKGYRSEIENSPVSPFEFVPYGDTLIPNGDVCNFAKFPYAPYQESYYIYNEENCLYERFQFGEKQADENNGEVLAFTNVFVLYMQTYNTLDKYGHYNVTATGTGDGFYLTQGRKIPITWKKPDRATPVSFYTVDGDELLINRGKSAVQICTEAMADTVTFSDVCPSE